MTLVATSNLTAVEPTRKSRKFRFNYGATITKLPTNARIRVWLPVPKTSEHQKVEALDAIVPAQRHVSVEPKYGNEILYFESTAPGTGKLSFETSYDVERYEVLGLEQSDHRTDLDRAQRELFLSANRRIPLEGKPLQLIEGVDLPSDPLETARALYNVVDEHVRYDKSRPGFGRGDVLWVCESRFGNCTDFHSLFISLARAKDVPAQFEIGFPLPAERGSGAITGYHCWAFFHTKDRGWLPVDISEADKHPEMKSYYFGNLTENRITLSNGRDLQLLPPQDGQPLNFFVYPYIEVDGQTWPLEDIKLAVSFVDKP